MTESGREDWNRHAGIKHLRCHEVTEIVKSEVTEACGSPHFDEPFGHEVRRPWPGAGFVGTENEPIVDARYSPIS
jgi:hypothetical protein